MQKFAVIGLGHFGYKVAVTLAEKGAEVIAIDKNMESVEAIQNVVSYAVKMDSTDEKALSSQGLRDMDAVIVAIGEDFEANLLTSVLLKQMGVKKVITRASKPVHRKILELVGVDRIVSPEDEMGVRLANNLVNIKAIDYVALSDNHAVVQIRAPKKFVGKSVGEIALRNNYNVNLVAIKRHKTLLNKSGEEYTEEVMEDMPQANTLIDTGDTLMIIGDSESIELLTIMASDEKK